MIPSDLLNYKIKKLLDKGTLHFNRSQLPKVNILFLPVVEHKAGLAAPQRMSTHFKLG